MTNDITLNSANINNLFSQYRQMDVQYWKQRKGDKIMDDDDYKKIRDKRHQFRTVMNILGIMGDYYQWLDDMGVDPKL